MRRASEDAVKSDGTKTPRPPARYVGDEDEAFAVLRWHSQHSNIKLRDIAAAITDHTNDPGIADLTADGKITEILADLTDPANRERGV